MVEQRKYPRVNVPVLVEVKHASLGTIRATAQNLSAGGLFVPLEDKDKLARLQTNARLKVRLLSAVAIEPQPTPTVDMVVARIEDGGIGLKFANETSRFLWQSAPSERSELTVGQDYFQVYLSVVLTRASKLLLLEQRGHWLFPGTYLRVGQPWREAIDGFLLQNLTVDSLQSVGPLELESLQDEQLPQAATLRLFYHYQCEGDVALHDAAEYRDLRWVDRPRVLEDLTFARESDRAVAMKLLEDQKQ